MLFRLSFASGKPVYLQLVDQVRAAAASGVIQPGELLPAIRTLAVPRPSAVAGPQPSGPASRSSASPQRDMRYLALALARTDGQPGPYLRRLDDGACHGRTVGDVHREMFPVRALPSARNRLAGACARLRDLAESLSWLLGTVVIDCHRPRGSGRELIAVRAFSNGVPLRPPTFRLTQAKHVGQARDGRGRRIALT